MLCRCKTEFGNSNVERHQEHRAITPYLFQNVHRTAAVASCFFYTELYGVDYVGNKHQYYGDESEDVYPVATVDYAIFFHAKIR